MWGSDTQRQDQEQTNEDATVDVGQGERHAKTRSGTN